MEETLTRAQPYCHPSLGLPASRILRHKFLLFLSHLLYDICYGSPNGLRQSCSCEHTDRTSSRASKGSWAVGGPESSASFIAFKINPPLVMNPGEERAAWDSLCLLSALSLLVLICPHLSGRSRELQAP